MTSEDRRRVRALRRLLDDETERLTRTFVGTPDSEAVKAAVTAQVRARVPEEIVFNGVPCVLESVSSKFDAHGVLLVNTNYKPKDPQVVMHSIITPQDDLDEPPGMDDMGAWRGYR